MESWMLMILVIMPGVLSGDWSVTFQNQCALRGGSVVMKCSYDYPRHQSVTQVHWSRPLFTSGKWWLHSLSSLPSPPDFEYVGNRNHNCNLKINNVKPTDAGYYYFSFETESDRWTSKTHAYLSVKELTAVLNPSTVKEGDDFSLTCVSECRTTIVWFKDGQLVPTPGFPVRREDAGSYYCAVLGQETVRSNSVTLNVQYGPVNISISVDDPQFAEGSSVNLTCSSEANPAADNYTWYKTTDSPSSSSWLQVGWGQVLSLSSVEASHTGIYLCQASNSVGTGNSTDLLVTLKTEERGSQMHLIIAGVGVIVLVTLVVAHLLYWKRQRTNAAEKGLRSSSTEDQLDTVYANINTFSSSPRKTHHKHYVPSFDEAELIYTTVAIKPRNNSRAPKESWATIGESEDSVIYSTVVTSS